MRFSPGRVLAINVHVHPTLLIALVLLAGCAATPPGAVGDRPLQEDGHFQFGPAVQPFGVCPVVDCGSRANFEPSIAVGTGGILVASSVGPLARSVDGGASFQVSLEMQEVSEEMQSGQSWLDDDQLVQADAQGTIWMSVIMAHGTGPNDIHTDGIYIASTKDAGLTWNPGTTIPISATEGSIGPDRQWLTFAPGRMLLTFQQTKGDRADASYSLVSTDGGAHWNGLTQVAPAGGHGRPIWDGRQFVAPYATDGEAWVATSSDGVSWTQHRVPAYLANGYPAVASDRPGSLWGIWTNGFGDDARLVMAHSTDGGTTWSAPTNVSEEGHAQRAGPWAEGRGGALTVAYYEGPYGSNVEMKVAAIHDGRIERGTASPSLPWGKYRATDFANFALDDAGILAVYADGARTIYVARSA